MTYVIHGATGAQGAPVVSALASARKPVTAVTRNENAVVDGARVVAAAYSSPADLTDAYRGAAGVFVHLPVASEEDRQIFAGNILAAVREARPTRVVFSTSGIPMDPAIGGAAATLAAGLADSGVSHAVIAPELYLENLLMPYVIDSVRERGVLPYAIRADFAVSWASHLDIADVAVALFERPDVTGTVSVGQYPAITGPDLADAFGTRLGREVVFEPITPEEMRTSIAPLVGEGAAADIAGAYQAMSTMPGRSIAPENSAQKLLGLTPRTTSQWLADIGV
ncbi:SDR family oxidoreductase [Streptomyces sp. WI04-05B]|uniref:SDR family oxidoreductase n=1 Tax=Streptomyces TaxID=1883 RepID=UPI0029A7C3D1|nr:MULTISPECIES: NmrA family NAD(P)-binding protein [unclassified Streptomyces]MDX2546968.1 NmrA family NAD(P)-binding protein [Streptomyces sp. WI04-05B]MDX2589352.1 NmrA family NAD(P)-binding protein [Streptomyces sp. WI04-05A]